MLAGLDPTKAAGSDTIKSIVLRTLKDQMAPMLHVNFQKSLDSGQIPSGWEKGNCYAFVQKG